MNGASPDKRKMLGGQGGGVGGGGAMGIVGARVTRLPHDLYENLKYPSLACVPSENRKSVIIPNKATSR